METHLKMKQPIIISGFPGIGKTVLAKKMGWHDSDSSLFSWESPGVRHPEWPANYIRHIKSLTGVVLVSTHKEVREAMAEADLRFWTCKPGINLKDEYIRRYIQRGSPPAFVDLISRNWYSWLVDLHNSSPCGGSRFITLCAGEFATDRLTWAVEAEVGRWYYPNIGELPVSGRRVLVDVDGKSVPIVGMFYGAFTMSRSSNTWYTVDMLQELPTVRAWSPIPEPGDDSEITRLTHLLITAGVCPVCGEELNHHMDEPFSTCACGSGEDHSPGTISVLRSQLAHFEKLDKERAGLPTNSPN